MKWETLDTITTNKKDCTIVHTIDTQNDNTQRKKPSTNAIENYTTNAFRIFSLVGLIAMAYILILQS